MGQYYLLDVSDGYVDEFLSRGSLAEALTQKLRRQTAKSAAMRRAGQRDWAERVSEISTQRAHDLLDEFFSDDDDFVKPKGFLGL